MKFPLLKRKGKKKRVCVSSLIVVALNDLYKKNSCSFEFFKSTLFLFNMAINQYLQVRGSHVGTYLPSSGVWHHTQRYLKKGASNTNTVHHLDFDAPTREHAHQLPDDKVLFM